LTRQATATGCAEAVCKSLRLWNFEGADVFFAAEPVEYCRLKEHVRGVPCSRDLAATRAMAVVEPLRLAANFILHGATQATTLDSELSHAPPICDQATQNISVSLAGETLGAAVRGGEADPSDRDIGNRTPNRLKASPALDPYLPLASDCFAEGQRNRPLLGQAV